MTEAIPTPSQRALAIRLITPVVAVGVASILLITYLLWLSYGVALRNAETETLNYATILETRIDATLRRIDGVLATLASAVPEQVFALHAEKKWPHITALLDTHLTNFPEAMAGRLFDTKGNLLYTSGEQPVAPINVADREWFKDVMSAPAGARVISKTIISRASNQPTIAVARALRNEQGAVYGAAIVAISLATFQQQFEALDLGAAGTVGLRRADDHTLLLRWPHLPDEVNKPLKASNPVVQGIAAGKEHFYVHITAQTDGVERIFGVHHSRNHPLYVIVGITAERAFAQWRQQLGVIGVSCLMLMVVVFFVLRRLWVNEAQRVRIETALGDSERRLAGVINGALDAIISVDSEQRIVLFNPAAQQMFGHTETAVLGQKLDLLIPQQFRAQHRDHVHAFFTKGSQDRKMGAARQLFGLRADGTEFPIEASISRFQSNAVWVSTVILRDISERRASEMALADSRQELARSNADLEQFAYAASHDLIEPLRSVASCVQMLQLHYAGQLDARADTFITHAVSGATRMKTLIHDLLSFSRIDSKPSQVEAVSMENLLAQAIANLREAIVESSAQITHDPLPQARAYSTLITQLFQNLIANAIKFRGDKAAVVHVGARQEGPEWVFSVADQGIGIDAQHFGRVFELFKRLHTRDEYGGTGIGLALCKKIVERHGGRIWVESTVGQGSTFFFTLPQ